MLLVGGPAATAELPGIVQDVRRGPVQAAVDPSGRLAQAYAARGVTVLLLAPDGVVSAVARDVTAVVRLEPALAAMLRPSLRPPASTGASVR